MEDATVAKIELMAIGPHHDRGTWSSRLGPMYEALIIARLTLSNGVEGIAGVTVYTEHEFDRSVHAAAGLMAPFVLGRSVHDIPKIYRDMRGRYVPLNHVATSIFDIAMHDGKAKTLGLPIYKMLGAAQEKIRAYASSPLFGTDEAYVAYVHTMLEEGYGTIKIHPYCQFDDDLRLVKRLIRDFIDQDVRWILDADANYTRDQALRIGRVMDAAGWEFFEAPLPDNNLKGYGSLANALDMDVVYGGTTLPDPHLIELGLQMGAWDRVRFEASGIGGFTGGNEAMAIARAHGVKCELLSWGYTLSQAANLHLMLANSNCEYLEQASPFEKYEFGAHDVLRPDMDGYVHPTDKPGLGIDMNWDAIAPCTYAFREFVAA
ncbi:MAG: enolase C-terminal domain-like protein [Pseudomonadota bacterium]